MGAQRRGGNTTLVFLGEYQTAAPRTLLKQEG